MGYDKERAEWYGGVPAPTRCTRNMPIEPVSVLDAAGVEWKSVDGGRNWKQDWFATVTETVTWPTEERINNIGADKVMDFNPEPWSGFKVFKVENCTTPNEPTIGIDMNKYQRKLTNPLLSKWDRDLEQTDPEVIIDVYDVLDAFDVSNPATAHAIKKLLCTGSRGAKDWETDLQEAIDSLERAKSFPPMPF
jgi:hypothetical protein